MAAKSSWRGVDVDGVADGVADAAADADDDAAAAAAGVNDAAICRQSTAQREQKLHKTKK